MMVSLLLALAILSPLRAEEQAVCREMPKVGCYYVADSLLPGDAAPLIIYHRGWLNNSGVIAAGARLSSSRQAFARYGLKAAAEAQGAVLVVTGSSDVGVTLDDLSALQRDTGRRLGRVTVASHSGGYVGLSKTLDALGKVDRIVMLDTFYFAPDLSKKIQQHVLRGAGCAGFLTAHNKQRYEERFKPIVYCPVEAHDDYGHEEGVVKCLLPYLRGASCP